MEYRGLSYQDAASALQLPEPSTPRRQAYEPPIQQPDTPPDEIWQARARILIKRAEDVLWSEKGKATRQWLQARGLNDDTIRKARIGYIPTQFTDRPEAWGKPGDDPRPFYFDQGILIPGIIGGNVWYLKTRPSNPREGQKYKQGPRVEVR